MSVRTAIRLAYIAVIGMFTISLVIHHHQRGFEESVLVSVIAFLITAVVLWFPLSWVWQLLVAAFTPPKQ